MKGKRHFQIYKPDSNLPKPSRDYNFKMRLNLDERQRLENAAIERGLSMSELIRDYIKRLPKTNF